MVCISQMRNVEIEIATKGEVYDFNGKVFIHQIETIYQKMDSSSGSIQYEVEVYTCSPRTFENGVQIAMPVPKPIFGQAGYR